MYLCQCIECDIVMVNENPKPLAKDYVYSDDMYWMDRDDDQQCFVCPWCGSDDDIVDM